ncbi:MAG: type II toxin-antitoxin system RelE/ParE family toxin [Proteobacteria bacterium]|nr:type II toxin-antitoxin system RelE/ParE family toxin [Pseudomonadota bacterium]
MNLSFARSAASDLGDIVGYISRTDPALAKKIFGEIREAAGKLAGFPHIGRPGRVMGTRELIVATYPYILVYTADLRSVTILAVLHAARDIAREMRKRPSR